MSDEFRFLRPWTLLLPDRTPSVLAVAGSGGRTTLMLRLWRHYRERGHTVLWVETSPHPAPFDLLPARCGPDAGEVGRRLLEVGSAWVEYPGPSGVEPSALADQIEELRRRARPDVLLVDAQSACGTPLRRDREPPRWPHRAQLAFVVGNLAAVGGIWGPATVAGVESEEPGDGDSVRRIRTGDVLDGVRAVGPAAIATPEGALAVPFLTALAGFRDLDGMFRLVSTLWEDRRTRVVCLAELVGDERRDAADRMDLPGGADIGPWEGERVYAVYPAHLDEEPGPGSRE